MVDEIVQNIHKPEQKHIRIVKNSSEYKALKSLLLANDIKYGFLIITDIVTSNILLILENKNICLSDLLSDIELSNFKIRNNVRIREESGKFYLEEAIAAKIITFLEQFVQNYTSTKRINLSTERCIDTDIIAEDEMKEKYSKNTILRPRNTFNYNSFLQNKFADNSCVYKYNKDVELLDTSDKNSIIHTAQFEISALGANKQIASKYSVICTGRRTNPDAMCNTEVIFGPQHLHTTLKCYGVSHDSIPSSKLHEAHTLTNLTNVPPCEFVTLYTAQADVYISGDKVESDVNIYCLNEITSLKFNANCICVQDNELDGYLILGQEVLENKTPLEHKFCKYLHKDNFLQDLFYSIKYYLEYYHKVEVNDSNKIIALEYIYCILSSVFLKQPELCFVIGLSGTGKTYLATIIGKLLSPKCKYVMGTSVTRAGAIGGQSTVKSNGIFTFGFLTTHHTVIFEEVTCVLDDFNDDKKDKKNNPFSFIKMLDTSNPIDVGIQGGKSSVFKSSMFFLGNVEQLNSYALYKERCARECIEIKNEKGGNAKFDKNLPMFAPIEYYLRECNDRELAEAHRYVRTADRKYMIKDLHYVTKLPIAEQSRFTFFNILEEKTGNKKVKYKEIKNLNQCLSNLHTTEILEELGEKFDREKFDEQRLKKYSVEKREKLASTITEFFDNEILNKRNNFKECFRATEKTQLYGRLIRFCINCVCLNKMYYDLEYEFVESDKKMLLELLSYNYNTLDSEEASMRKKPYINDFSCLDGDALNDKIQHDMATRERKHKEQEEGQLASIDFDGAESVEYKKTVVAETVDELLKDNMGMK